MELGKMVDACRVHFELHHRCSPQGSRRTSVSIVHARRKLGVLCATFFSPTVRLYFTRSTDGQRTFTIRGAISMTLLMFAVFAAHSIAMGVLRKALPFHVAWKDVGIFLLPALLLNIVARWHLEVSLREISALLLAASIFFANELVSTFLAVRFVYSDAAIPYYGWLNSMLMTLAFGASGFLLTVYITRRYRVAST